MYSCCNMISQVLTWVDCFSPIGGCSVSSNNSNVLFEVYGKTRKKKKRLSVVTSVVASMGGISL